jgi:lauroyl/myristoyl acyltransferase
MTQCGVRAAAHSLREACLHWSDAHGLEKRFATGWSGLALKSATKFLPLLSRKACYRLALFLGSLGAMLDRRGRHVALSNLRVAFGDEISSERRAQIVRESYQHFARTMFDFFWSPRLTSQPGGRYRVVFHPRIEFPAGASLQEMAQACWDQFEPVVRKNPAPCSGCTSIGVIARWRRIWRRIHSTRIFRRISSAVSMKARAIFGR